MTSPASVSGLTPEFDEFLFARINADTEETPLSMLSVLARLGLDPWEEAAKLAQLPRASAAQRLVSLIAAIPSAYPDAGTVSNRLICLLPSPLGLKVPRRPKLGFSVLPSTRLAVGIDARIWFLRSPSR
jgi:hypothetical protein